MRYGFTAYYAGGASYFGGYHTEKEALETISRLARYGDWTGFTPVAPHCFSK